MLAAWCSHQFRVLCLADLQSHSPEISLERQHTGRQCWLIVICTKRRANDAEDGAQRAWLVVYILPRLLFVSVDWSCPAEDWQRCRRTVSWACGTSCFLTSTSFGKLISPAAQWNRLAVLKGNELCSPVTSCKRVKQIPVTAPTAHAASQRQLLAAPLAPAGLVACTEWCRRGTLVHWGATSSPLCKSRNYILVLEAFFSLSSSWFSVFSCTVSALGEFPSTYSTPDIWSWLAWQVNTEAHVLAFGTKEMPLGFSGQSWALRGSACGAAGLWKKVVLMPSPAAGAALVCSASPPQRPLAQRRSAALFCISTSPWAFPLRLLLGSGCFPELKSRTLCSRSCKPSVCSHAMK